MTTEYPTAQLNPKSRFSLIWIIPLTAALIGGWLVFKYYSERGTMITIILDDASGVEAKKTPVRYKSVQVGKVKKIGLTSDLKKVKVTAEIFPGMAKNLTANTRFWVVKPRVSFQGISGLDTLLSGVHIGMDPGNLNTEDDSSSILESYIGLSKPPIITSKEKGTSLTLKTSKLGSLDISSPVYYRKIKVGEVTGYHLDPDNDMIDVSIYVHAPYDNKIKTSSRFWNASGLELELTTSGVSVRMESLTSLLVGGIAFETPTNETGYPLDGKNDFKLYDSYKLANDDTQRYNKLFYVMYFTDTLHGLGEDSLLEYNGVKVGKVESILLESAKDSTRVKTLVKVSFRIDKFSAKGDREEAEQTLRNLVKDGLVAQLTIDSLITGAQYIALKMVDKPNKNHTASTFTLLPTNGNYASVFPTTRSQQSLLNFDASEITQELNLAISSITALINSKDVEKTLKGLASTSESISKITQKLEKKGFSGELVNTLTTAKKATQDIRKLIRESQHTMVVIGNVANKLQKDASQTLRTVSNVGNKLQRDVSKTLNGVDRVSLSLNKGLKNTLSEDSALQYRLQQLINDLSEASNSFSILADTLQRKPNSIIFGK
ncbi:MAG TPA: MCE family protein [Leucothrix sp.]|nr:MCE family protein [Leucothrix sp.]